MARSFAKAAAHGGKFVAVQIANIRCIEIGVVMRAQARGPVGSSAKGEGGSMKIIDRFPRARAERNHRAVASRGWQLIEGFSNPQCEFARAVVLVRSPA